MDLQGLNINTNTMTIGGKIERIQVLTSKAGTQYVYGSMLNEYYKEGLQFPLKTYFNFKCFVAKCVDDLKTLKPGSTLVASGYFINDFYLNKNKEKVYEKYLFIEKVKVLSDGKKESPSDHALFTEEDLPF